MRNGFAALLLERLRVAVSFVPELLLIDFIPLITLVCSDCVFLPRLRQGRFVPNTPSGFPLTFDQSGVSAFKFFRFLVMVSSTEHTTGDIAENEVKEETGASCRT